MSVLRAGDERFHYSDGSHRWIPLEPDDDQEAWEAVVRQHQARHLDELRSRRKDRRAARPKG